MSRFAVLNNQTGAAGTVTNVVIGDAPANPGWINIDAEPDPISIGWTYDGISAFTLGIPPDQRQFYVIVTDILVNAGSVLGPGDNYAAAMGDTFELSLEIRRTEDDSILAINQTRDVIVEGQFGSNPQVRSAAFVAGIGTLSIDTTATGTYQINETGLNFSVNNPSNFIDFRSPAGGEVINLTVTP